MSDNAWKKKYLELLDKQERLENNFNKQADVLKRGLIRSSLAAEGNDEQLDQQLQGLRNLLRKQADTHELEQHINRLEKAILQSEKKLQQRREGLSNTLTYFVQQLLQLQPPKDIQKSLRAFEKNLHKQLAKPHSLYPALTQLKDLQERVLSATVQVEKTPQAQPGLFSRWFKGSASSSAATEQNQQAPAVLAHSSEPEPPTTALAADTDTDTDTDTTIVAAQPKSASADDTYAIPLLVEASYSSVALHIHNTLTTLLNDLPITAKHEQQVIAMRSRINKGLNWYELAPLLDELSIIVLAIACGQENDLEQYLLQLNHRLASLHDNLQVTSIGYNESVTAAKNLDHDLREHVSNFQSDVHSANDLVELKKRVDSRIDTFIGTLQTYQESRERTDSVLLERFQALAEHSKQMEKETQLLSTKLEEQRQKALLDPLTGLPNRAAWAERSELEYARIQRNQSSLLLSIIDIDHFKRINDNYGHLAGDKVLKIIAQELNRRLRKTDFIARFGGEEYVILLPDTPLESGLKLLNTLRTAIEACPFHFKGELVTITFSAGIGQVANDETLEQAFERVDQALYAAKNAGRNNVKTAS